MIATREKEIEKKFALIVSMLKIGCIGFGGGNALIPVIQKKMVEEGAFISIEEYEEDVVVASITPGALPVELAGGVGKRTGGRKWMLICAAAMAFPGAIMTVGLLSFFPGLSETVIRQVDFLTVGITGFIVMLLLNYICDTFRRARIGSHLGVPGKNEGDCRTKTEAEKRERRFGARRKTARSKPTKGKDYGICLLSAGSVFLLTCGKSLYGILGVEITPAFGLSTIQVFAIVFFWIFFTNGKWDVVNVGICGAVSILYVLCAGQRRILSSSFVYEGICALMLILAVYGFFKNNPLVRTCREWKSKNLLCDVCILAGTLLATTVAVVVVAEGDVFYIWKGFLSSVISFGGGDAYLTVADGMFVQSSLIAEDDFYGKIVPIVNILPGSILCKTLSAVGYCVGYRAGQCVWKGYLAALCGFLCSVVSSCTAFSVAGDIYRHFEELPFFLLMKKWIRPIISGLMGTVILSLVSQNRRVGSEFGHAGEFVWIMLLVCAADFVLGKRFRISNGKLLVISAAVSYAACSIVA